MTDITNRTLVHQIWADNHEAELIATFQFFGDAQKFVEERKPTTTEYETMLAATDTYSGRMYFRRMLAARPDAGKKE